MSQSKQFGATVRLSTPADAGCTAEQVAAARVFTANHVERQGLTVDELDELLDALGIGPEVKV